MIGTSISQFPSRISLTFEARGDVSAIQALRDALRAHAAMPMNWHRDEPTRLSVTVPLPREVPTPDMAELDAIDTPGLELAVIRIVDQGSPLPPLRVARAWLNGQWTRTSPASPFKPNSQP